VQAGLLRQDQPNANDTLYLLKQFISGSSWDHFYFQMAKH
jgi:hypothetical protein